ncbi:MAG: Fur family transcriptional regulator [Bacilli bacterium]|jgi:Fur family ferric uptake transcriptional regulator
MNESSWPKKLKKTRVRQAIVNILRTAETPLSALDITSLILKDNDRVWPSTLYRNLEALVTAEVVRRIALTESHSALYELTTHKHSHYAICLDCRKMFTINNCPLINYEPLVSDKNFTITNHKMEIYGYCGPCFKKRMGRSPK